MANILFVGDLMVVSNERPTCSTRVAEKLPHSLGGPYGF
jgi:hypothetical protein